MPKLGGHGKHVRAVPYSCKGFPVSDHAARLLPSSTSFEHFVDHFVRLLPFPRRADEQLSTIPRGFYKYVTPTLSQTISNPPTQAQVTAIQNKLNELILAMEP
jgi:hypothetical protein